MKGYVDVEIKGKQQHFEFEVPLLIEKPQGYNSYMIAIELAGPVTATRAAWAELVKGGREAGVVCSTGVYVELAGQQKSINVLGKRKLKLRDKDEHMLLLGPEITDKTRLCFVGGSTTEPSLYFMDALRRNVHTVPVKREWALELWQRGIAKGTIKSLLVHGDSGLSAWELEGGWTEVVKEMVLSWRN